MGGSGRVEPWLEGGALRDVPVRLWKRIEAVIEMAPVTPADRIRLRQYTVFLLLGVPTMVAYGLQSLVRGNNTLSAFILASAIGLLTGWCALGRMKRGILVYRINTMLFGVLLVYMLIIGGDGGSKILWMFTFPMIVFFLLGEREGVLWAAGMLLLGAALLMVSVPGLKVYAYPRDFRIRFLTIYAIVAAIAFWFEHFRETYRTGMETKCLELETESRRLELEILERQRSEREKEQAITQLKDAIGQVRVLSGLLPICASCKKIRDEHGTWNQLEAYIDKRSEAKFSHGICPDCARRLYPGFLEKGD
jgi:hypothetical protein